MKIAVIIVAIVLLALLAYLVVRRPGQTIPSQAVEIPESDILSDEERLAELRAQNLRMTADQILARSREDLQLKTAAHAGVWHLGSEDRWDFSQDDGTLTFTFADTIVVTRAQLIGSYVYSRRSWLWSWGNERVAEFLKQDALVVRQHMIDQKLPNAGVSEVFIDEAEAWDFTSLACYLADAQGGYSSRNGDMRAFFTFHSPQIKKR